MSQTPEFVIAKIRNTETDGDNQSNTNKDNDQTTGKNLNNNAQTKQEKRHLKGLKYFCQVVQLNPLHK